MMRFAYADPPYLGCGRLYAKHHPEAMIWDNPETHRALIQRLCDEYPDGWAMSLHVPSLRVLLPMCPDDARISALVKPPPWTTFPGLRVSYAWEPVIWRGGRKKYECGAGHTIDWLSCGTYATRPENNDRGLIGGKPRAFCRWVFSLLGAEKGDTLDDLFPGTGAVTAAWREWVGERDPNPLPLEMHA
jgi:hypothetical protein